MKKAVPFLLLVILAVAAWYFFLKPTAPVIESPVQAVVPVEPDSRDLPPPTVSDVIEPEFETEPVIPPEPLPVLSESDPEVMQALGDIANEESLSQYLVMDQVISRAVASIDSLTSRQVPVHINPITSAKGAFLVDKEGEDLVLSPRNFARYDDYVALLQQMDAGSLVSFYGRYAPLFQEAWEQNGGLGSFDERMIEVIDNLLETPDVPGPVYLTKPEAVYVFEDPNLEAMTAGQKVLVRMGSVNATVVKQKLAEVKAILDQ